MAEVELPPKFIHQRQPTNNTCVSACVGMAAGVDASVVASKFHDDYFADKITIGKMLDEFGVPNAATTVENNNFLLPGEVAIITVPSLNKVAEYHCLLADYRVRGDFILLDPSRNSFYTADKVLSDHWDKAHPLQMFTKDYVLWPQ